MKFGFQRNLNDEEVSHPSRGAWIEMLCLLGVGVGLAGRTPHGVRGLKWSRIQPTTQKLIVAPLTECVD